MRARLLFIALLVLPLGSAQASGRFIGRVTRVMDGDTVDVMTSAQQRIRIRLAEIDAPENHQAYGNRSKQELSSLVLGKVVGIIPTAQDRYGRTVAHLRIGQRDVSAEMIRRGAAWVYLRYSSDRKLPGLEARARAGKIGLWRLPSQEIEAPWIWRDERRGHTAAKMALRRIPVGLDGAKTSPFSCATKRYCSQMISCQEAIYHLRICGQSRLDGDHDGKPCEKLCG